MVELISPKLDCPPPLSPLSLTLPLPRSVSLFPRSQFIKSQLIFQGVWSGEKKRGLQIDWKRPETCHFYLQRFTEPRNQTGMKQSPRTDVYSPHVPLIGFVLKNCWVFQMQSEQTDKCYSHSLSDTPSCLSDRHYQSGHVWKTNCTEDGKYRVWQSGSFFLELAGARWKALSTVRWWWCSYVLLTYEESQYRVEIRQSNIDKMFGNSALNSCRFLSWHELESQLF